MRETRMSPRHRPTGISRRDLLGLGARRGGRGSRRLAAGRRRGRAQSRRRRRRRRSTRSRPQHSTLHRTLRARQARRARLPPGRRRARRAEHRRGATCSARRKRDHRSHAAAARRVRPADRHAPGRRAVTGPRRVPRPVQRSGHTFADAAPFRSAYRPQEMLTTHVAESMVQAVNALRWRTGHRAHARLHRSAPATTPTTPSTTRCAGTSTSSTGQSVRPDSGDYTKWEGVGGPTDLDPSYWHPDGTPPGGSADNQHTQVRLPDRARPARQVPRAVPRHRAEDAVVRDVRQPRRAGAGQHPVRRRRSTRSQPAR